MYINTIDNLFDGILNNFNKFIIFKNFFSKISKEENFVKYQNEIINHLKDFTSELNIKEISTTY